MLFTSPSSVSSHKVCNIIRTDLKSNYINIYYPNGTMVSIGLGLLPVSSPQLGSQSLWPHWFYSQIP